LRSRSFSLHHASLPSSSRCVEIFFSSHRCLALEACDAVSKHKYIYENYFSITFLRYYSYFFLLLVVIVLHCNGMLPQFKNFPWNATIIHKRRFNWISF
jgi:hypothetical protein